MVQITENFIQFCKEIVTAAIGIAIIGFTLFFFLQVFGIIGETSKIVEAKNLLTMLMGLAGVVVGYYFGRAPADAQAANANTQAAKANDETKAVLKENSQIITAAVTQNGPIIDQIGKIIDQNSGNVELVNELNTIRNSLTKNNNEFRNFL